VPTKINFRGGRDLTVRDELEEVSEVFRNQGEGPVRLITTGGGVIFVNWTNVLYIEEARGPADA
jgi:hypothetical protein